MIHDATSINLFRECPEKHRQRMALGLVPDREEEAPASGQVWHVAMRVWFGSPASELAKTRAALIEAWGEEPLFRALPTKRPRGLFEALLDVYAAKFPRERDAFTVVRNESWCEGYIGVGWGGVITDANTTAIMAAAATQRESTGAGPAFAYGGIVDRLIELDGRRYVMDTKTTSNHLTETYFASYELSTQLRGYMALELVSGRECEGVYIDAVHVDTKSHKAKPEHCQRHGPIRYDQARLSEWARDVEHTIGEIERLTKERGLDSRWPQHDGSCRNWGRLCAYFDRCQVAQGLASTVPGFRVERWEPNKRGHDG